MTPKTTRTTTTYTHTSSNAVLNYIKRRRETGVRNRLFDNNDFVYATCTTTTPLQLPTPPPPPPAPSPSVTIHIEHDACKPHHHPDCNDNEKEEELLNHRRRHLDRLLTTRRGIRAQATRYREGHR